MGHTGHYMTPPLHIRRQIPASDSVYILMPNGYEKLLTFIDIGQGFDMYIFNGQKRQDSQQVFPAFLAALLKLILLFEVR